MLLGVDEVYPVDEITRGYIDQQLTKLNAHHFCNTPYITYVDSDCIFTQPCCVTDLFHNNKAILLKTPYSVFAEAEKKTGIKQNVLNWKHITENILGFDVEYEYMRRFPLTFSRYTLTGLETYNIKEYARKLTDNSLSEFNLMGAYAEKHHPELYYFVDTEKNDLPPLYCHQFWSWGGISKEIRSRIEEILA